MRKAREKELRRVLCIEWIVFGTSLLSTEQLFSRKEPQEPDDNSRHS
jgi:hypothetical protein